MKCAHCGRRFEPRRVTQICCRPACRTAEQNRRQHERNPPPRHVREPVQIVFMFGPLWAKAMEWT